MPTEIFDDLDGVGVFVGAVRHEILADLLEPRSDARRHRGLDAFLISVKLVDDHRRNQQDDFLLVNEHAECNDPALPVPSLRDVQPCRGVDEQVQHRPTLRTGRLPRRLPRAGDACPCPWPYSRTSTATSSIAAQGEGVADELRGAAATRSSLQHSGAPSSI